jgi:hypothetical protein
MGLHKTDVIILYRTKRRYGITKDDVARQDKTGSRGHRPRGQGTRIEGIRQEQQDRRDHTKSAEHEGFDRIHWTDGVRQDQQDKWD